MKVFHQKQGLIRGHSTNHPRASDPILPQTKNVEQFGGAHRGPPPSSRQNHHSCRPWQGSKQPRWLPSSPKKIPLAPALARQQMAEMVVVITTILPMPALTRHQTAKEPAIIVSAIIMTTHPMPALARHQIAEGLAITLVMGPHLKGLQNASKHPPPTRREGNSNQWRWSSTHCQKSGPRI